MFLVIVGVVTFNLVVDVAFKLFIPPAQVLSSVSLPGSLGGCVIGSFGFWEACAFNCHGILYS